MQPGDDESDLHPRQRFPGVPVPFIAALWELVSKGINAVFIQGGGGFVIQRPKEFIAHCLERFESLNMVDTFTRQVNLYQFAYIPTSSVSRHKLWESNTLGAIVYSDPRGIFTSLATALELSNIRPARLKRKARGHHPAECLRRGIHVYCRSCLAGIGEEGSGTDDDSSISGPANSQAVKIRQGTRGRQSYSRAGGAGATIMVLRKPSSALAVDAGTSSSSPVMPESELPSSTFEERQPPTHVVSGIAGGLQDFLFAGGASLSTDFDCSNVESWATRSAQAGSKRFASHDDATDVPAPVSDGVSSLKRSRIDALSAAASVAFSLPSIPGPAVFLRTTDPFDSKWDSQPQVANAAAVSNAGKDFEARCRSPASVSTMTPLFRFMAPHVQSDGCIPSGDARACRIPLPLPQESESPWHARICIV